MILKEQDEQLGWVENAEICYFWFTSGNCTSFGGWTKSNVDWEGAAGLDWIEACKLHAASESASGHLIYVGNIYT